jgi:hypothetical protein
MSTLVEKQYANVCEDNPTPTPKLLCDDWVFRQCSYHGGNVGVYVSSSSTTSQAGSATMDHDGTHQLVSGGQPVIVQGGGHPKLVGSAYEPWQ